MKRRLLFLLLAALASLPLFAYDFAVNGIYYKKGSNGTCSVTYRNSNYNSYSGDIVIPESVTYDGTTYSVTSIEDQAFNSCSMLTSVTIPNSVTSIGYSAFFNCTRLTSVTIPNSVTSIDGNAFFGCTGLTSVTISNSVTSIGKQAFYSCSGLTSVILPNSVTSIGNSAFSNCTGLTEVTIPNAVTSIGDRTFYGCSRLASVTIPDSVTWIGASAFSGCSGLTSVTIPSAVTEIGSSAFYGCSRLTSVTIPNAVTSIGSSAFSGCSGLTSVTIPSAVTSIGDFTFYGCTGLTSVIIPNAVTSIGDYAFSGCEKLTSVIIPNAVTTIGTDAFKNCTGLQKSAYPNNLSNPFPTGTRIGYNPEGAIIENGWIYGPEKSSIFFAPLSFKGAYIIPNSVTSIGNSAFYKCSGLTSLTIPSSVTSIDNKAFYDCSGLKELIIEDGVPTLSLGRNTSYQGLFRDCPLESVYLGRNLSYPTSYESGYSPFHNSLKIKTLTIGNSVTSIDNYAFYSCTGLTEVIIPNAVTSIGTDAFKNCTGLQKSAYPNNLSNPFPTGTRIGYNPEGAIIENGWIYGPEKSSIIFAPLSLKGEYVIPNSVTKIGNYAFFFCTGLTSITIPNSVKSIDNYAFSSCTGLKELTIEDGEQTLSLGYNNSTSSLRSGLFSSCPLETLYLGRNLSYETGYNYGYSPFYNKSKIKTLTIGNSVTEIGNSAFSSCTGLTEVIIPNAVTTIGTDAFKNCTGLKKSAYPNNLRNPFPTGTRIAYNPEGAIIENGWIYGPEKKSIYFVPLNLEGEYVIPDAVTTIGTDAFTHCSGISAVEATSLIPPTITNSSFSGLYDSAIVTVPAESIKQYLNSNWSLFKNLRQKGSDALIESTNDGTLNYYLIPAATEGEKNLAIVKPGNYSGEIIIPERFTVTDDDGNNTRYYVTGIGKGAFKNSSVTKVTFNSRIDLKIIGNESFSGCTQLIDFTIPSMVESIGESAFAGCSGLTSATIGNYVTELGDSAFAGCSGLTEVTIGNAVTSIGNSAFQGCSGLTEVTIPNSVTEIGNSAFAGCSGLTEVTIPNYVTEIGNSAFAGCSGLTEVTIGNAVTSIGNSAFQGCTGITEVSIPTSVTEIGNSAFAGCSGLKKAEFASIEALCNINFATSDANPLSITHQLYIAGQEVTDVVIPNSVTKIGNYAFYSCSGLTSVNIGNAVTKIGNCAFEGCSGLTEVTIPNSVSSIGSSAFSYCYGLTSLTLGNSLTSIGESAFNGCNRLSTFTIPSSVTSINNKAFYGCSGLKELIIEDGKQTLSLGSNTSYHGLFGDCPLETLYLGRNLSYQTGYNYGYSPFYNRSKIKTLTIGNSVTEIGSSAFYGCSGLTSVILPNSVTSIGNGAFDGCSGLSEVTIPNSVTSIGSSAFYGCRSLTEVSIPNSVTSIGGNTFSGCTGLTSLSIPNSVTSIDIYAFYNCSGLNEVSIGNAVTSIGGYAFSGCTGLTSLSIPNSVTKIGGSAFKNCSGIKELIIEDGEQTLSLDYNSWSSSGGEGLFYDCPLETIYLGRDLSYETVSQYGYSPFHNKNLTIRTIAIGNTVTSIGDYAFFGCSGVTSLTIPNSVTSIGSSAFAGCTGLNEAYFADSATAISIKNDAFDTPIINLYWGRPVEGLKLPISNLESLTIGNSTAKIPNNAFKGLTSLQSLTMGSGLTEIGANAFSGCTGLTEVVVPIAVETIGASAFEGNTSVKTIIMGANIKNLGENAFKNCPANNVYITTQTPPEAPNTAFSAYTAKLWLQDPGDDSVIDAYYDVFNCWDRFDGYAMVAATGINVDENPNVSLEPGQSVQLTAKVEPENVALPQVFWRSTNPEIATIDANGVVTVHTLAENASTPDCKIIAESLYANGPIAEIPVFALKTTKVEEIRLNESELTLTIGETLQLEAEVLPAEATDKRITWSSADPEIVSVSNSGLLSAIAEGSTVITAASADGKVTASCAVTVTKKAPEPVEPGTPLTLYRIHNKHHAGKYLTMADDKMLIAADLDESNPQQLFRIEPAGDKVLLSAQGTYVAQASHTANIQNGTSDTEPGQFYMVRNGDEVAFDKEMPNGGTFADGSRALSVPNINNAHVTTWATGTPYSWWYLEEVNSLTLTDLTYCNGNYYGNITMPFAFSTDAEVYTGLLNDNMLNLTKIDNSFVAAGKPVIIRSTSPEVTLNFLEDANEPATLAAENHLSGNFFAVDAPESAHAFCLLPDTQRPAFAANSRAIGRNESYLDSSLASHNEVLLNIDEPVSINELSVDGTIEVYDLRGVRIGDTLQGLPHGIYIVKTPTKTAKIAI